MSDTIVVAGLVLAGPLLLSWLNGRQMRSSKKEDWKRQDIVSNRAMAASDAAIVAAKEIVAANLKSARLLEEANIHAIGVDDKLAEIHGIVNSTHTTALRAELTALEQVELLVQEDMRRDTEEGLDVSRAKQNRLAGVQASIGDLERILHDRDTQQAAVDEAAGIAKGGDRSAARVQRAAAERQIEAAEAQTQAAEAQTRAAKAHEGNNHEGDKP